MDTDADAAQAKAVIAPAPVSSPLKPTQFGFISGLLQFAREELDPFWAAMRSGWFWATLGVLVFLMIAAFQLSFTKTFDLDSTRDRPYLIDYYATERYQGFIYRWAKFSSNIVLKGVGQVPRTVVKMELSDRPANYPKANIEMLVNSGPAANFSVTEPRKIYQFDYNLPNRPLITTKETELNIWMKMNPLLVKGDERPLGIVVSGIQIEAQGLFQTGRPVIPDWRFMAKVLGCLAVLWILGKRAGWSAKAASLGVFWLGLILVCGIILDRPTIGQADALLLEAALLTYPLAVIGLRFTGWWLKRQNLSFGLNDMRWLAVIFALAYIIRIVGLNHPSFQTLDHGFRIHEVAAIADKPSLIFSRYYNVNGAEGVGSEGRAVYLGQWGLAVSVPYTPLFYIADLPVNWLTGQNEPILLHWTNNYAAWFDVAALFFLYIIARQTLGRFGPVAGLVGSLLFCFFPLSYLMVSDGGYNNMLATWLMLAWLVVMTGWFTAGRTAPPNWKSVLVAGGLLALTFLAHSATAMIVGGWMLIFLAYWLLSMRRQKLYRGYWGRIAAMFTLGAGLAFASYYGFYFVSVLRTTLPTLLNEIGKGNQIGGNSLSLRGFWASLSAHFHLLPFFVTVGAIGWPTTFRLFHLKSRVSQNEARSIEEINPPSLLLYVSWLTTFLMFSLIASRVNLLQKHMLFGLPLFALGVGLAMAVLLDFLQRQTQPGETRPARLQSDQAIWIGGFLLSALVVWIVVAGSYTWYIRVIDYILPAGTG